MVSNLEHSSARSFVVSHCPLKVVEGVTNKSIFITPVSKSLEHNHWSSWIGIDLCVNGLHGHLHMKFGVRGSPVNLENK